ncbi:MAG: HAMP domain-containing sensor histidine kinase [Pseudomonadota bacterium]
MIAAGLSRIALSFRVKGLTVSPFQNFADLSFRHKALVAPLVMLVLLAAILLPIWQTDRKLLIAYDRQVVVATEQATKRANTVGALMSARMHIDTLLWQRATGAPMARILVSEGAATSRSWAVLRSVEDWLSSNERQLDPALGEAVGRDAAAFRKAASQMIGSRTTQVEDAMRQHADLDRATLKLRSSFEEASEDVLRNLKQQGAALQIRRERVNAVGIGMILLGIGLAAALNRLTISSLSVPVNSLMAAMRDVAQGRADTPIPQFNRKDELGKMAAMAEKFRGQMVELTAMIEASYAAELEVERSQAALAQARELAFRQREFLSIFSHELQTPITIIDGNARQLAIKRGRMDEDTIGAKINAIRTEVQRVGGLIGSLLDAAKAEEGAIPFDPSAYNLKTLISEEIEVQTELAERHRFESDIDAVPDLVMGDPALMQQVFRNLLSNAIKYSPDGGSVRLRAYSDADWLNIDVADEGVGIPEAEIPRIAERYYRATSASGIKGNGIGLNLVKHLLSLHGGELRVSSVLGTGTTLTVRLPHTSIAVPQQKAEAEF